MFLNILFLFIIKQSIKSLKTYKMKNRNILLMDKYKINLSIFLYCVGIDKRNYILFHDFKLNYI